MGSRCASQRPVEAAGVSSITPLLTGTVSARWVRPGASEELMRSGLPSAGTVPSGVRSRVGRLHPVPKSAGRLRLRISGRSLLPVLLPGLPEDPLQPGDRHVQHTGGRYPARLLLPTTRAGSQAVPIECVLGPPRPVEAASAADH
jgi:hypothetical protein